MIRASTFSFLAELSANNEREWFQFNKARHDEARDNVLEFTAEVIRGLSETDKAIPPGLDPKNCVMRIYRDVRFSKDKTPYKTNFGAGISQQGKNFNGPGYYVHIHPEQSFIAGGCWLPESGLLKSIRQEIDYNGAEFRSIIKDKSFMDYFGNPETEYKLKTVPKGYSVDHPEIEYLKLKSFTFSHILRNSDLTGPGAVQKVVEGFAKLYPFMAFLRNANS